MLDVEQAGQVRSEMEPFERADKESTSCHHSGSLSPNQPAWLPLGKVPEGILNLADFIIRDYHDSVLLGGSDDST
jgi:hypothetical protein